MVYSSLAWPQNVYVVRKTFKTQVEPQTAREGSTARRWAFYDASFLVYKGWDHAWKNVIAFFYVHIENSPPNKGENQCENGLAW